MLKGLNNIQEFIRFNQTPKWIIRRSENSNPIFTQRDKELTIDESLHSLRQVWDFLEDGRYFIEASQGDDRKQWVKDIFEKNNSGQLPQNTIGNINTGQSNIDLDEVKRKAVDEYRKDQELKELKERVKELESPVNKVIGKLEPYIGTIIEAIFTQKGTASVAGFSDSQISKNKNSNMPEQDLNERATKAIENWFAIDKQAVEIIERIPAYIKQNPDMYKMLKSQLLQ